MSSRFGVGVLACVLSGAPRLRAEPPVASFPIDAASAPPNTPASAARRRSGIQSGNVALSAEERHLFGIRVQGVGFRGALGGADSETRRFMPSVFAGGWVGQTREGLAFDRVDVGAELDARTRYLHAGLGLGLGYLWIARTTGGAPMGSVLEFAELHLGPEFPLGEHFALALDARLAVDAVFGHDTTLMLGPGVGLRLRYY